MDRVDIMPRGGIEFGRTKATDGTGQIVAQFVDAVTGLTIRLFFDEDAFVTFADHARMLADEIVEG